MTDRARKSALSAHKKQQLRAALAKSSARSGASSATQSTPSTVHQPKSLLGGKRKRASAPSEQGPSAKQKRAASSNADTSGLTPLQQQMQRRLQGARFRWLNEQLYTTEGDAALRMFTDQPVLFNEYHEGFRKQVEEWPENPLERYVQDLLQRPPGLTVADMGCGEAMLAAQVNQRHTVHSFDLVAGNERITACDIAHVPLEAAAVDVVIFCLSLMGTNFLDFIREARRILRDNGELRIAEVKSRFTDISRFIDTLRALGFKLVKKDDSNTMFICFEFVKESGVPSDKPDDGKAKKKKKKGVQTKDAKSAPLLKPCIYKRR